MIVRLPPVFRVNTKENGNSIQQVAVAPWIGEATVTPLPTGRLRGFSITRNDSADPRLLLTNSAAPGPEDQYTLRRHGFTFDPATAKELDLSDLQWVTHPKKAPPFVDLSDYERNVSDVLASWIDVFRYKREDVDRNVEGLRPPQLGAIYAVQAHWTVHSDPATVVLPTGVGKTETMLSLLIAERCQRLLVVVPTDALRTQIAEKFLVLGLLKSPRFQIVAERALYPVVGILNHRPATAQQVESLFRKCNMIVTTMPLASQCTEDVTRRMAELSSCLFIDEAHHVAAPTWKSFKDAFATSRIIQFTATPFRDDDRSVDGKRIFTFSLRQAQEQGYFKPIQFKPVAEFDPARKDIAIAKAAVAQLRTDAHRGHILMARVATIARAGEVFECYRGYAEFNPVQLHTGIKSKSERDGIRNKLLRGDSRIVVCVDMLGEGFDLPELKIAAFHDIRKSLAVTLQLVGRFTRDKPHLGNATVIANIADLEVKDELKKLYQHSSDWNALLPALNEQVIDGEVTLREFLAGFQEFPEEIPLHNIRPAMSTVVYRTCSAVWTPENFPKGIPGYDLLDRVCYTLNPENNTLVVVTARRVSVEWAQIDEIYTWDWQLYVVHWDDARRLLFIHNSSNSGYFKDLAQAVAGDVKQVRGPDIFRCLAGINRLKLQNVGLLEQLGRLIRYTMRAGSDIEPALSASQKQRTIKANIFGQGFEHGQRTTIGCSYKGRLWSYRTTNLRDLTTWCREVGEKLLNTSLDPEDVLRGTLSPVLVSTRPSKMPIAVEWPDRFYREPELTFSFEIQGRSVYSHEAELSLVNPSKTGPLKFAISSRSATAQFELQIHTTNGDPNYSIQAQSAGTAFIKSQGRLRPLQEFFEEEPPTFWFADGSSLVGNEYVALRRQPVPFPRERIDAWDWTATNIRVESQTINRRPTSIQYRVISELKKRSFSVVFDDDDAGESADVVGVIEHTDHIEVEFWHCKFAMEDQPGARIKELYEVCGQAQKSIRWLDKPRDLFSHLLKRDPRRYKGREATRFEVGSKDDLLRIRDKVDSQPVRLRVTVVQPGLSKAAALPEHLELLAVTESYLQETFAVPFAVVVSC